MQIISVLGAMNFFMLDWSKNLKLSEQKHCKRFSCLLKEYVGCILIHNGHLYQRLILLHDQSCYCSIFIFLSHQTFVFEFCWFIYEFAL